MKMYEWVYELDGGTVAYFRTMRETLEEAEAFARRECPDALDATIDLNIYEEDEF